MRCFSSVVLVFAVAVHAAAEPATRPLELWYDRPAAEWVEALPIGNGRLGAMVFGGRANKDNAEKDSPDAFTLDERLQFNEDSFWTGGPYVPAREGAWKHLDEARRLIFEDKLVEAHQLVEKEMMAIPRREQAYQPAGDVELGFPELAGKPIQSYRRSLDLRRAVATTEYQVDGVRYKREAFSSPVDQVLVVRVTADKPGSVSLSASLTSPHEKTDDDQSAPATLMLTAHGPQRQGIEGKLRCHARLKVIADGGPARLEGGRVVVDAADAVTLLLAADTNFVNHGDVSGDPEAVVANQLREAERKGYGRLLADHVAAHRELFDRVGLDLGTTAASQKPTDQRVREFGKGDDPQLAELYFQFGRYLLISSSRPGCEPANLQGLWNDKLDPPWESKYTCNINFEMNYWPAETTNLPECHEPLFAKIRGLAEAGRTTAREHYNARGWVTHHNTDLWCGTAPVDGPWGMWPCGGAWLCEHLWQRYEFSLDRAFLAQAYPLMKGSAEFFVDALVEDPNTGRLVTCPSTSPENRRLKDERIRGGVSLCSGPTMDAQILRDLFSHCRQAAEILGVDESFRAELKRLEQRLPPMKIGAAGQLQEWQDDYDLQAPERRHRHVSHLYGLYPSDQIDPRETPDLFAAARKSLELRGDGGTGWSKAWKINFWAHLLDGDRAYRLFEGLIATGTYPNLFDAHPPFQIDGNFGGASGLVEMLVQSRSVYEDGGPRAEIDLLPALPAKWPTGRITGVRTRGGFVLDLSWRNGRLEQLLIRSPHGVPCVLRYDGKTTPFNLPAGGQTTVTGEDL